MRFDGVQNAERKKSHLKATVGGRHGGSGYAPGLHRLVYAPGLHRLVYAAHGLRKRRARRFPLHCASEAPTLISHEVR